jgi:hypothetical protein
MSSGTPVTAKKRKEPSSWSRLPEEAPDASAREPEEHDRSSTTELLDHTREQVGRAASRIGESLRHASDVLAAPAAGDVEGLLSSADLPELESPDPLSSLSRRLDREADLWRALALRALARAGWADRFTQAVAVLSAIGCVALAAVAAVSALFAAGSPGTRSLLLLTGGAVLCAGSAAVAWTAAGVRRAQHTIARDASRRGDLAELRLHRIGAILAIRQLAPEKLPQALERLEQDVSAPSC